jgi:MFS family permease
MHTISNIFLRGGKMKIVDKFQVFFINAYWFGMSFMWNSLNAIVIPVIMLGLVSESVKNTWLGLIKVLGLIIAIIVQPVAGAVSDGWVSKWGRRRPMILIGTIGDVVFLAVIGWAAGIWGVFIGFMLLQVFSNIAQGPLQGLLPDVVPAEKIGIASGIKIFSEMTGLVIGMLALGMLIPKGSTHPTSAMLAIIIVLAVCAVVTLMFSREKPTLDKPKEPIRILKILRNTLIVWDVKTPKGYWWLLVSRFFFVFGITAVQTFAMYFIKDKVGAEDPVKATTDLMAALGVFLMVFAVISGWLGGKVGYIKMLVIAGILGIAGSLLLMIAHTPLQLLIFGSMFGTSTGIFLASNWSLANNMAQGEDAGKLMGLSNLATAGAPLLAQFIGGPIDIINSMWPGRWHGYTMMFLLTALFILLSTLILAKVPEYRASVEKS